MNYHQAIAFIDAWGEKPDEWFVCSCDYNIGVYGLAHDPGGKIERTARAVEMAYPDGTGGPHFYVGDLVRVKP